MLTDDGVTARHDGEGEAGNEEDVATSLDDTAHGDDFAQSPSLSSKPVDETCRQEADHLTCE